MRGQFKLVVLLGSLLAVSLTAIDFLVPEKNVFSCFFSYLSYPMIFLNHKVSVWYKSNHWWQCDRALRVHNVELQNLVLALQAENVALAAKDKYWHDNKEIIEFSKRYDFANAILAQAFFKHLGPQEHYMLLDKGLVDGVQQGMVAVYNNCLLGRVVTVYPKYCQLVLLTDRTCRIAVYDEKTGAVGICCGKNDVKQLTLSYVSHLQKIEHSDLLISSGEGETFPQGFGVGKVANFEIAGMYYAAETNLLFDLENISSCYLISANKA